MEYDLASIEQYGIDTNIGLDYMRGADKYIRALQRYIKAYNSTYPQVSDNYNNKDWKNYCIQVHSLKSNSKMIGAISLSKDFEALELASKSEDIATVDKLHEPTMSAWKMLIDNLAPIGELETEKPADELNADEAKKVAEELMVALDDFDDELSAKLVKKLAGYPFRLTQRGKLEEATTLIEDFLYDDALELIKEIAPEIK